MTQHTPSLNIQEAEALAERYFEGATTEQEERMLRSFLMSDAAADARFDEVKATMSYFSVARHLHRTSPRRHRYVAAVAASLFVALTLGLAGWYAMRDNGSCRAIVAGHEVSQTEATQLMLSQMQEMFNPNNTAQP